MSWQLLGFLKLQRPTGANQSALKNIVAMSAAL
jgi:hypothetical protein